MKLYYEAEKEHRVENMFKFLTMKTAFLLSCLFLTIVLFVDNSSASQEPVVTVEAYGTDRADALLQAKREAISQGIGTMLTSETEVNNFVLKKDIVLSKITGGVKKITVLNEREAPDGTYYVKITAVLAGDSIKKDLMALHLLNYEMDYPSLLVLLQNDLNNQGTITLTDFLISRGFHVVDPNTISGRSGISEEQLSQLYNGSSTVIAQIGEKSGADYVLLGNLTTQNVSNDFLNKSGLLSCASTITVRIINCHSGTILASKSAHASAAHVSGERARLLATQKAAKHLLDDELFDQLITSFQDSVNNGFMIHVHIGNLKSYSQEKKIRKFLQKQDIVSLHSKGFFGNAVDLTVHIKGNTIDFCDKIDGRGPEGSSFSIMECRGDKVTIMLQ